LKCRIKKDLPTPAPPVRKTFGFSGEWSEAMAVLWQGVIVIPEIAEVIFGVASLSM
jgi:hypothetical protein